MSPRDQALTRTLDLLAELVAASRDEIDSRLARYRVRLIASPAAWSSLPGQLAVATLVNLLVRSGIAVEADVPAVAVSGHVPGLRSGALRAALDLAVAGMLPGAALSRPLRVSPDVVVTMDADAPGLGVPSISLGADSDEAWVAYSGRRSTWAPGSIWTSLAAAGLGAIEVHKLVLGELRPRAPEAIARDGQRFRLPFSTPAGQKVAPFIAVSAGAIIQNALFALAADPSFTGRGTILDADVVADSNLNRCPLAFATDIGRAKVDVVVERVAPRIELQGLARHIGPGDEGMVAGRPVMVGVDDIPARHVVQAMAPGWLGVGATSHFLAMVSEHRPGSACAACVHPKADDVPGPIPTVSIVSFWAGFLLALRFRTATVGVPRLEPGQVTTCWPMAMSATIKSVQGPLADCVLQNVLPDHP